MRFEDTKFACIDFETTGFSPKSSRAIELAIVDVQYGEIGDSWTSLLNPGPDCDMGAEHIHGINSNWVSDAPRLVTSLAIFTPDWMEVSLSPIT